jgi:hypothetical protein
MLRTIKVLVSVAAAMAALGALGATGAWGANFTASSYPTGASAGQTTPHKLTIQGSAAECGSIEYITSLAAVSGTIKVTPVYENCSAFGFINVTVEMNGCTYQMGISSGSGDNYGGTVSIVCDPGKSITIEAATCTVRIPAQTPTTPNLVYKNETGSGDILVTSQTTGIHSTVESGFLCPLSAKATDTSGKTTGSFLLAGHGGVNIDVG